MKTAIISLTKNGGITAVKVKEAIGGDLFNRVPPEPYMTTVLRRPLSVLMPEIFDKYDRFVLIMAVGIAVRVVAPLIKTKDVDPAIVVMDEKGMFAISFLSGHLGGANDLALELERKIQSIAVITTATDVNNTVAFDMVAKKNNCVIPNLSRLAKVSSAVVNGRLIKVASDFPIEGRLPRNIVLADEVKKEESVRITNKLVTAFPGLILVPKNLVLGIGCRRGTPYKKIRKALTKFLHEKGYNEMAIDVITSVDIKADEKGLIELSRNMNVPFYTYDPDQLRRISSKYTASAFVAAVTGTPSVAEAAALIHAKGGFTIVPKTVVDGITFSLAEVPTKIKI